MKALSSRIPLRSWRGLIFPVALVSAWLMASASHLVAPALSISLATLFRSAASRIADGSLPFAVLFSVGRALAGWSMAAAIGLVVGIGLGSSRTAGRMVSPTLGALRQIALFAWIPLLSAWLGTGEAMKVALIGLGAFMPVALNTEQSVRNVPKPYREVGRLLELGPWQTLTHIVLPAAAPGILAGLELALTIAWIGTIGAEYLIGTGYMNAKADGIGVFLASAREYARMDLVIVGVATLAVTGLALNRSVAHLSQKVLPWHTR